MTFSLVHLCHVLLCHLRVVPISTLRTSPTQNQQQIPQVRGESLLQLAANHETLIRRASEQAACARTVESGQFHITNESVMDGNSSTLFFFAKKTPGHGMLKNSRLQAILDGHVKIGPLTEIEVFASAGALVREVQVPSRQPGDLKSWVRITRGIEQRVR